MPFRWPLKFTVQKPGEGRVEKDRFGNETIIPGVPVDVPVFSYEVTRTEEQGGDSILRTIDDLQIIAPPGTLAPSDTVTIHDGTVWQVQGNPEDNTKNPYFDAGLVIYHARRTQG